MRIDGKRLEDSGRLGAIGSAGGIDRSYATGRVSGGSSLGGLVGEDGSEGTAVIEYAYWDVETSGLGVGGGSPEGSAGGLGYSTAAMQMQSTYEGFVFPDDWIVPAGSYPELVPQEPVVIHSLSIEAADISGGQFLEIHASGFQADVAVSAVWTTQRSTCGISR